jgi:hypothetical protein
MARQTKLTFSIGFAQGPPVPDADWQRSKNSRCRAQRS